MRRWFRRLLDASPTGPKVIDLGSVVILLPGGAPAGDECLFSGVSLSALHQNNDRYWGFRR